MRERGVAVFPSWGVAVSPGCIRLLRVAGALTIQGTSVSGSGVSTGKPVNWGRCFFVGYTDHEVVVVMGVECRQCMGPHDWWEVEGWWQCENEFVHVVRGGWEGGGPVRRV